MSDDKPGNSIFIVGQSAGEVPGGAFIFHSPDGSEMFRVSDQGVTYNGESIKDAGRLHKLMVTFFSGGGGMRADNERLRSLLREFIGSGVEFRDDRISYVTMQVDKDLIAEARELLEEKP